MVSSAAPEQAAFMRLRMDDLQISAIFIAFLHGYLQGEKMRMCK